MKKLVLITATAILLITAGGCSSGRMASTGVYYDDIYYAPDLRQDKKDQAFEQVPSITDEEKQKELKKEKRAQIREYEQSEEGRAQQDNRDFTEIQEKYASILSDEETEEVDSLVYYNDETGYWVDGFRGSSMDRSYAERLVRFHGPFTRIPYSSPLYTELVHFNDPYWNVYVDGHYAYAFPTWSNPWYDRYRYDRWSTPWSFGYSSWGYNSYWGYSSFYSGYYDPYFSPYHSYYSWGYHNPYYRNWYRPYYYHNPAYYGYHHSKKDNREVSKGIKPNMRSNTRYAGSTSSSETLKNSRRDGGNEGNNTMSRRGTRTTSNETANRENTRSSSRNDENLKSENTQRRSVTRYQGSGTSTGTVQTQSRRSSTPSYSQPENDSRPSYNRTSGYTRQVNTNTRSRSNNNDRSEARKSDSSNNNDSGSNRSVRSRSRSYSSGSSDNRRIQTQSYQPSQRSKSSSSSNSFNNSNNTRSRSSSSFSGSSSSGSRSSGSSGSSSGSTIRSGRR